MANRNAAKKGVQTRKKIYDFIKSYIKEKQYPPSIREIGEGVGIKSVSTTSLHLYKLKDMGVIDFLEGQPRTIRVLTDLIE